jgi:hypothetical protein
MLGALCTNHIYNLGAMCKVRSGPVLTGLGPSDWSCAAKTKDQTAGPVLAAMKTVRLDRCRTRPKTGLGTGPGPDRRISSRAQSTSYCHFTRLCIDKRRPAMRSIKLSPMISQEYHGQTRCVCFACLSHSLSSMEELLL